MQLFAIFLILNIQLSHIFAFPPSPVELSSQARHNLKGYECGNVFFTDKEVKEALKLALDVIGKGHRHPQKYRGQLYSESKFNEHLLYPIRNGQQLQPNVKHINTVYYIVITKNYNEEVDVVAKITVGGFTKCIRTDSTHVGPLHTVPENANGYLCGHKFFADDIIHQSLALAQTKVDKNTHYPCRYYGRLFPKKKDYQMWPIINGKNLYTQGKAHIGPYFLIINNDRQFVDVVVRGYMNNYLRCIRSREVPKAPASDPYSKLFVPPPKSGYICGKDFFDNSIIEENVEIVKSEAGNASRGKYPIRHSGPPFKEECLIWSLLQDGSLSKRGHRGPYRLILTLNYEVLSVAIYDKGEYKLCERNMKREKKNHDMSDYHCNEQRISHEQLVMAAEEACVKMDNAKDNFFPAKYEDPGFKLDGSYFTFPVFESGVFGKPRRFPGLYRVVINTNCEVVGALTTLTNVDGGLVLKKLVKCHRLDDGPLPPDFFGANARAVNEYMLKRNKLIGPVPMER